MSVITPNSYQELAGIYSMFLLQNSLWFKIVLLIAKVTHASCREFTNNKKLQGSKDKVSDN